MMYRILLFAALLTYCLSASLTSLKEDDSNESESEFGADMVDGSGSGYSFFIKQRVESRPSGRSQTLPLSNEDLHSYMQGSALNPDAFRTQSFTSNHDQSFTDSFNQQPWSSRSNFQDQNFSPRSSSNNFGDNQRRPSSNFLSQNAFGNQQQKDLRTIGQQQILLPQNDFNSQQNTFANFGNQQQDPSFFQNPQQTWSSQQNGGGFSSSFGGQGQQNDRPSVMNTAFMSSQVPTQRRTFQSQPMQRQSDRFNGW